MKLLNKTSNLLFVYVVESLTECDPRIIYKQMKEKKKKELSPINSWHSSRGSDGGPSH